MSLPFFSAGLCAVLAVFIFVFILWEIQRRSQNASWVDFGWIVSIVFLATFYFFWAPGALVRKKLIYLMVFVWGTRLARHLFLRIRREGVEDARYRKMRLEWGSRASFYFFLFFMLQAFVAVLLTLPFFLASMDTDPHLRGTEIAGLALWFLAFVGETAADRQLEVFKADPAKKGKVCQSGLWNYSRHPNYFFECLIWVSYFLFAAGSPYGYYSVVSPALMIFFITAMSGIPPAEAQSLRSKGELYRRYQETTSVLIPWFKKRLL